MKKIFLLFAIVSLIANGCVGSDVLEENNGGTPFSPKITISLASLEFDSNGGEQNIDITTNFEYKVSESADWLNVEVIDSGINVVADRNENTQERSATITISSDQYDVSKAVNVRQAAYVPKIELSNQSIEVEFEPNTYTVSVTSPYSWKAESDNEWIDIENKTGIAGTEELSFKVERNEEEKERKGTILLTNSTYNLAAELYVTQKIFKPEISIEPETLNFTFEGGIQEVVITSNFEYEVSVSAEWVTFAKIDNGIAVSVHDYTEIDERSAEITISSEKYNISKTVKVLQGAFEPEISIEPETLNFAFEGGIQEVVITSNFEYEVSVSAEWVTFAKIDNGIAVSVHDYTEIDERSAEITISSEKYNISKTVKVLQGAFEPEISIKPETLNFAFEGGVQEVVITTNFEYTVSENVDWLSYVKTGNGIKITTSTNVEEKERTADVIIYNNTYGKSTTIKVIQQKFVPTFTINTTHLIFEAIGGTQNLNITTNFDYQIVTNADWLSYKKTSSGVVLTATANIDTKERSANITISNGKYDLSRTVNVSQNALSEAEYAKYSIFYTSTDGNIVTPFYTNVFGANIVSNTYENGKGIIKFDAPVTEIGTHAFKRCSSLTSVTIPDSVTEIGYNAFSDCSSLTSVTIPDSVTEIGSYAFYGCSSLASVTIGNSVTNIGYEAFYECKGELVINSKTLVEKDYPTSECPTNSNSGWLYGNLFTKLTIDDNITKIGLRSFRGCSSLRSITIPNSVTTIENEAFRGCSSLTSVTIPESVTRIGYEAFYGCWNLRSITIPNSVTKIGGSAFYECRGELVINSKTLVEKDYTTSDYPTINSHSGWLYGNLFTKLTIGDNVTKIGNYTFCRCSSLGSVTIGNGVTLIGESAFGACNALRSVTIPDSVTEIGMHAFYNCHSLTSVTIGNSVTKIGMDAFYNCSSLKSVHISDLSAWCKISFFANPLFYAENLYLNGNLITELTIPSDITEISGKAFRGCSSLTSVTIPDSVTTIGGEAFLGCSNLTSVTIPDSVTTIGGEAFRNCRGLTSVYCRRATPPTGGSSMFSNNASGRNIYVPRNSVSAYMSASYWSSYASYIVGYDF